MDDETKAALNALRQRVELLEKLILSQLEEEVDPIEAQHREFMAGLNRQEPQ